MEDKCYYCKEEILGNPKVILKILTMCGYDDLSFDSIKCFLKYIIRKHRRKLNKFGV